MGVKKQSKSIPETEIVGLGLVQVGRIVEHQTFGVGTVVDIALWESGEITVNVDFESAGTKWLSPEYAFFSEPTSAQEDEKVAKKKSSFLSFFRSRKK
jgi:transcription elongation factor GreA-like protein